MNWLTWLFLESFPALSISLFVVLFWLLVWWRRGGSVRPFLVAMLIGAVLLVVQSLVTTQREHAARVLSAVERGVPRADIKPLEASLTRSFQAAQLARDEFIGMAQRRLQEFRVNNVRRVTLSIDQSGPDRFVALAAYQCDIDHPDFGSGWLATGWRFTFLRVEGEWRIDEIDLPTVNGVKLRNWRDRGF